MNIVSMKAREVCAHASESSGLSVAIISRWYPRYEHTQQLCRGEIKPAIRSVEFTSNIWYLLIFLKIIFLGGQIINFYLGSQKYKKSDINNVFFIVQPPRCLPQLRKCKIQNPWIEDVLFKIYAILSNKICIKIVIHTIVIITIVIIIHTNIHTL